MKKITRILIVMIVSMTFVTPAFANDPKPNQQMMDMQNIFQQQFQGLGKEGYGQKHELVLPEISNSELQGYKSTNVQDLHNNTFNMGDKKIEALHIIPQDSFFNSYFEDIKSEKNKLTDAQKQSQAKVAALDKKPLTLANPLFSSLAKKKAEFSSLMGVDKIIKHINNNIGPQGYGIAKSQVDHSAWGTGTLEMLFRTLTFDTLPKLPPIDQNPSVKEYLTDEKP